MIRTVNTRLAMREKSTTGNGQGGGFYVIGYRAAGTPAILAATGDQAEAQDMRDLFAAQLEGYERIAVETAWQQPDL